MASIEVEESTIDYVKKVLDFPRVVDNLANDVEELKDRVTCLERALHDGQLDQTRSNDIAEISDGGGGDVCIDVCDTTIWIPCSRLLAVLAALYKGGA